MPRFKIYTKTGDDGTSSLYNGKRLPKDCDYFQALGDVDELNSACGMAGLYCIDAENSLNVFMSEIQSRLLDVGSLLATPIKSSSTEQISRCEMPDTVTTDVEQWIDHLDEKLPPLTNFILPSGGLSSSQLHVCRTICRRAERNVIPLVERGDANEIAGKYLNRLSDFFFVAARFASDFEKKEEIIYQKSRKTNEKETDGKETEPLAMFERSSQENKAGKNGAKKAKSEQFSEKAFLAYVFLVGLVLIFLQSYLNLPPLTVVGILVILMLPIVHILNTSNNKVKKA